LKAIKIDLSDDIKPAVQVNSIIGSALPRIGPYKKLDNKKQVVALIDDVRFTKLV
jgi:dihydropyrimidine dehydrogenase (NADP+)